MFIDIVQQKEKTNIIIYYYHHLENVYKYMYLTAKISVKE